MASLIFCVDGREIARRRLDRPLVIGRSATCDIAIRDPLLSRQHCRIECDGANWTVTDLQSRNGTWLNDQPVQSRILLDGDQVRIGIVRIVFLAISTDAARAGLTRSPAINGRPAEPLRRPAPLQRVSPATQVRRENGSLGPNPLPRPRDPASYSRENLYDLFASIAATSFDRQFHLPRRACYQARPIPRSRMSVLTKHARQTTPQRVPRSSLGRKRWRIRTVSAAARLMILAYFLIACGSSYLK